MEAVETIRQLNGVSVVEIAKDYWGPSGELGVDNLRVSESNLLFDLLVPTGFYDMWDYIWQSEKNKGSTQKVQIFQAGRRLIGSQITTISREGEGRDIVGPEQYRLAFVVPLAALKPDIPIEVRFFWEGKLISTAISKT